MARYIQQLRRGWKDDTINDWATYESTKYIEAKDYLKDTTYYLDKNGTIVDPQPADQDEVTNRGYYIKNPSYIPPLEGELVLEYDNGIPRLKIGNGVDDFSQLPYMSVDSFILPKHTSVTIYKDKWQQASDDRWYQVVTITNGVITQTSKVDLQPSSEQLDIFHEKDLAFVTENEDGVISVYCVGQVPTNNYTIPVTITEVVVDEED